MEADDFALMRLVRRQQRSPEGRAQLAPALCCSGPGFPVFLWFSVLVGRGHTDSETTEDPQFSSNAVDPSLIPGSGRPAGEGIGCPLQYSWASLVVQLVKNPPAMQVTWVQSLSWEDPLEKGKATHSSILAWRIPWTV